MSRITIHKKGYSATVLLKDAHYEIRTDRYMMHRILDGILKSLWEKGLPTIQSGHGTGGRKIVLVRRWIKGQDIGFQDALTRYLKNMFGPDSVTLESESVELRKQKNALRDQIRKTANDAGIPVAFPAFTAGIEAADAKQLDELKSDLKG